MMFEEILSPFIYGKKIRRSSWNKNFWIETNGSSVKSMAFDPVGKVAFNVENHAETDKLFSMQDVFADDWEIYK